MFLKIFASHNAILFGVLLFSIGLWVYFGNRNRPRNVTMASLLVTSAFWSFAHILWRAAEGPMQTLFWFKTLVFISTLLPTLLFFFVVALYRNRMPNLIVQAAVIMPNLLALWFIFGTDGVVALGASGQPTFGMGGYVLGIIFGIIFLLSLLVLLFAARQDQGLSRVTLLTTFGGSILAFDTVFAVLISFTSYHDLRAFWFANAALAAGMLIIAVPAVGRRMLEDLRVIGGELFVLIAITLIVADVVISETLLDFTFRLVLLVVLIFYGVIILRSLTREVQRLKQVEMLSSKLSQVNRELVAADKMKTRFLSFASHQMRSPLSGILGYMSMLLGGDFGKLSTKQREVLGLNVDALGRLRETIETFLDVSKIEMGGLVLNPVEANLELLVAEVMQGHRPSAAKKGVELKLEQAERVPTIMADLGKLYHALSNLVDNAVKYTDRGLVTVSLAANGRSVMVSVTDTGRGMSGIELRRVRQVMAHGLEVIRFDKEGGSGLGIHIASKIVQGHGGKITVTSAGPRKGSTFTIHLPRS